MIGRIAVIGCGVALAAAACGGKEKPPELAEPEPAWVADYQKIAEDGCACVDEDCLNAAHAAAVKMEADHGGIDDAPPSVHVAHGELDKCWHDGTMDLGRDLGEAADAACKCADAECINLYRMAVFHLQDKYKLDLGSPDDLPPAARETLARASVCITKVTIPTEEYLATIQRRADTVCRCETMHCAETSDRIDFGARFYVPELQSIQTDVDIATDRYCECLQAIVAKETKDQPKEKDAKPPEPISLDTGITCGK